MPYANTLKKETLILSTFFCFVCLCELAHVSINTNPPMPLRLAYIAIYVAYCFFAPAYIPLFTTINLIVERFSTVYGEFLPNTIWFHSFMLLYCWMFIRHRRPVPGPSYNKNTYLLFLFFFFFVLCSYLVYINEIHNVSLVANSLFSLLFVAVLQKSDDHSIKTLLNVLFASITFVCILGLLNYDKIAMDYATSEGDVERLAWKDANYFSCFIGISMLITIFLLKSHKKRLFYYISLLIQSICLMALISRGAILAFCLAALFYFRKQLLSFKIVGYAIALSLIIWVFYQSGLLEGVLLRFASEDMATGSGRDHIWEVGLTTFLSKDPMIILFGAGEGQAINMAYFSFAHWSPHNNYLEILFNYGFVGLSLFLIFLASLFLSGKNKEKRTILLFILINCMTIVPFTFVTPLWIVIALLLIWDRRISNILQA